MILSDSQSIINFSMNEFIPECLPEFPIACYEYDLLNRLESWHWHEEFEFAIINSGSAKLEIEGCQYSLQSGDGYFINSGSLHSLRSQDGKPCQICCFVFKKDIISESQESLFYKKYIFPLIHNQCVGYHFKKTSYGKKKSLRLLKELHNC